ncbi:MAG: NUDIX hydrolase [Candidatus Taylorbacteria bacterium]|nr:NUDIX hydrolase [Candidatus Taylorbacteria bacterium]
MEIRFIAHALIHGREGKILILRRSKQNDVLPGYWDIPGGTVEEAEEPVAAAIRETKEEAGLDISDLKPLFQTSNIDRSKNIEFVTIVYLAQTKETEVMLNADEHDMFEWIDPADVLNYITVNYLPKVVQKSIGMGHFN